MVNPGERNLLKQGENQQRVAGKVADLSQAPEDTHARMRIENPKQRIQVSGSRPAKVPFQCPDRTIFVEHWSLQIQ